MGKFPTFFLLLALAALAAAIFGAAHNQLSYSIGPAYFTDLKFGQFGIADTTSPRLGAAYVGIMASWWMGIIVGLPAFIYGLIAVPDARSYLGGGVGAIFAVILVATFGALIGLLLGLVAQNTTLLDSWFTLSDDPARSGFQRAGLMHNASYLAGALGLLVAFIPMRQARRFDLARAAQGTHHAT